MRKLFAVSILVLIFCATTFAQTDKNPLCPKIETFGPAGTVEPGDTATFSVRVSSENQDKFTYDWTISAGTIIEGRGTKAIRVFLNHELESAYLQASVKIKGLSEGCQDTFTEEIRCILPSERIGDPRMLDDYGRISFREEKLKLDAVAAELLKSTTSTAYFVFYHDEKDSPQNLKKRIARASNYLTGTLKLPIKRLVFVSGGAHGYRTVIYLAPNGTETPFLNLP